ncbi:MULTISPECIES: adenylate cyclase regulatory domain-containing protein [unclassified Mycolicibacterium]|uniref:adenylate/guanylate cyclase domain-containing protein n=1 Tax=unclassified Mycolicibacterium TaxID=2636767 RepID=UPI0028162E6F|nr:MULTISPECIES: adenylate cyclase regulatory domain-containing protein [unclassified Mycolicibacterium]
MSSDMPEREKEASGSADGLQGQARAERNELTSWLLANGFDIDQIRAEYSPMLLPAIRRIGDEGLRTTAREISDSTGVDLTLLQRLHRAAGLVRVDPDTQQSRADAESVLGAARLVDIGFDSDVVVLIVRLLMDGLNPAAATMRRAALKAVLHPGASELELAEAFDLLGRDADAVIGPMVDGLMRLALRHSFETEAINAHERATGTLPGARDIAVAFADLVGFTRLGEQVTPEELGHVAVRLADVARDLVTLPVQFVKTFGDAVMLICPDPRKLLITVLNLVEAAEDQDFPRLRVGVAFGPAASSSGDWFGSPVNVASRVTTVAPAGTVRVTEAVCQAIGDVPDIGWKFAEARQLKGIRGDVVLYDAHRAAHP